MLLVLNIKNFALIEALSITFDSGLNILTGETGAGKSILIDAINFVLGGKVKRDLIKFNDQKTYVEVVFDDLPKKTEKLLIEKDFSIEEVLIISREVHPSGKSIAKINGKIVLVNDLKKISEGLLNVHGQHENQHLLNNENHLFLLDKYGENLIKKDLIIYKEKFKELQEINNRLKNLEENKTENEKLKDYLQFQIEEIDKANLKINEDVELNEKYKLLSNFEKISTSLESSFTLLHENSEVNTSVYDNLGKVLYEINSIKGILSEVKSTLSLLEDAYYNIEQAVDEIRDIKNTISYDQNELDYINSRIFQIESLKRKYGSTIDEILAFKDEIDNKYNDINNSEEIIDELHKKKDILIVELAKVSKAIYESRLIIKEKLEIDIIKQLRYVGLEKSKFEIVVNHEDNFYDTGGDRVQFEISTNPGQPLYQLEKVVSGGELSRIMLSLKVVFADKDYIPTLIFDEIDTGISGRIAQRVAEKMYKISKSHQVFCVTHLPQIACMSDNHYKVEKIIKDKTTRTKIYNLDIADKENEIAKMIGGTQITDLTVQNAREMITMANEIKIKIK
ncbi:DNA repair protein RecN [Clostridium sp. DL1XJH146]